MQSTHLNFWVPINKIHSDLVIFSPNEQSMKLFLYTLALFICFSITGISQSIGDTIRVQTFDYSSQTRDTMVHFPNDTSLKYEKILMYYNMRCKGGRISTGTSRNLGCGEWDYSCNTYIHDSTRFDSTESFVSNYLISNFSGNSFPYSINPMYDYYQKIEKKTTILSTTSEDIDTLGMGTIVTDKVIPTQFHTGKTQFIYTAAELTSAGISPGNIDALLLDATTTGSRANQLKIKIKATSKTSLIADSIELTGFNEVFYSTTQLAVGLNRFQFHTPFNWDGTSNLIIEFSFTGNSPGTGNSILCHTSSQGGLMAGGDYSLKFESANFIESNSYKGVGGSTNRTMEAWIKTTTIGGEILSWGNNATGEKWNWRTTNNGYQRIEINGAGVVGSTNIADGNWHHLAAVLNGSRLSDVEFYVDGVLDSKTSNPSTAINTNILTGINVQVSKGIHNRYLIGEMDDLRIWNTDVSLSDLRAWKRKKVTSAHPNFSNLEMNYRLNSTGTISVIDSSGNGNDAIINGSANRLSFQGENLFKEITELNIRPNIHLAQGVYVLSTVNDSLYDSVQHLSHLVQAQQVFSKSGELRSDSIAIVSSNVYFNAAKKSYFFNSLGVLYDSVSVPADGTITLSNLSYYNRFPMKFEIMSFVTPYGINLDLGPTGKTWIFDVTDYTPFLTGSKRMTMERGGQYQEEMDISFHFIVGTPEREVKEIKEIWPTGYHGFNDIISNKFFAPRKLPLDTSASYYEVKTTVTGHGQQGEFIPRMHFLKIDTTHQFDWRVWKDCGENPVFPQGGTWIYDRAGWCPGMATDVQTHDITSLVDNKDSVVIDYGVSTASGTSNYIVSNKLVTFGEYNHLLDAAIVDVIAPSKRVEYEKENAICHYPKITIRNAGKTELTSLKIEFWVNNSSTKEVFYWLGNLAPSQNEVVEMHAPSKMWQAVSGLENTFHVEISKPNNGVDEYSYNNTYSSQFSVPDFIESPFRIDYRSNSAASETSFKIFDEFGTEVYSNSGQANNTLLRDTLNLGLGCYRLVVKDTDGDGIGFWANSDGTGYLRFHKMTGQAAWAINPDFGGSYTYNFTIGSYLNLEENNRESSFEIYPNPTQGDFSLEGTNIDLSRVKLLNPLGQSIPFEAVKKGEIITIKGNQLPAGVYYVVVSHDHGKMSKKLIIN